MNKLIIAATALLAVSCIDPITLTPDIKGDITALEVEGQTRSTVNAATRTVTIEVAESANLAALTVRRLGLVATATCEVKQGDVIDLTNPLTVTVTTEATYVWTISATRAHNPHRALPGGGFDEWYRADSNGNPNPTGRVWNPWPEGAVWEQGRWWDTGNSGVALLGNGNTTPTEPGEGAPPNPGGRAARLETKYMVLKAAGGNIYFGRFGEFTGTNATVHMGHPWQARPTALRGWYKYFPKQIDVAPTEYVKIHPYGLSAEQWLGSMDSLHVNVALWASPDGADKPFTVDTRTTSFVDFSRDQPGVIAYGGFASPDERAEWTQFDIPIDYLTDGELPANTYLILQATASKNCNYFIAATGWKGTMGSTDDEPGSLMYIDELELVYE